MHRVPHRSRHLFALSHFWDTLESPEGVDSSLPPGVLPADLAFVRRLLSMIEPATPDATFAQDLLSRILAPRLPC